MFLNLNITPGYKDKFQVCLCLTEWEYELRKCYPCQKISSNKLAVCMMKQLFVKQPQKYSRKILKEF